MKTKEEVHGFMEKLINEVSSYQDVKDMCVGLEGVSQQFWIKGQNDLAFWLEYSSNGITFHPGERPELATVRRMEPSVDVMLKQFSGEIGPDRAPGYGLLTYGPFPPQVTIMIMSGFFAQAYQKVSGG
jgi:hypothetical protein